MTLLNKLLIVSALVMVTGCGTTLPIPDATIPASLTQPCRPLEQLAGMTGKDLITNITHNAAIFYECSDAKDKLNEAVSKK